jgi:hypothetical protein
MAYPKKYVSEEELENMMNKSDSDVSESDIFEKKKKSDSDSSSDNEDSEVNDTSDDSEVNETDSDSEVAASSARVAKNQKVEKWKWEIIEDKPSKIQFSGSSGINPRVQRQLPPQPTLDMYRKMVHVSFWDE